MQLGRFYSSEGKYEFNGRWYEPRWFANLTQMRIDEAKPILEAGHSGGANKRPQAICLISRTLWDAIKDAGFAAWSGLTMWHYYDNQVNAGTIPSWMTGANGYDGALIHEYADGKVMFLKEWNENNIYTYFLDTSPIEDDPPDSGGGGVVDPPITTVSMPTKWHITGKLGWFKVDLQVEAEE